MLPQNSDQVQIWIASLLLAVLELYSFITLHDMQAGHHPRTHMQAGHHPTHSTFAYSF